MQNLENIIKQLIESKQEGEYWDFKVEHHSNCVELLHDILCFSNSLYHGDRYIIYGISDNYDIVGFNEYSMRRKQSDIIDFLRGQRFAGGFRPVVELKRIEIKNINIDVLVIKDSVYTPFYLCEDKRERDKTVRAYYIYSRIGDTNTPINSSADIHIIEKLWRKRFGFDLTPLDHFIYLLSEPQEWIIDLGNKDYAYHKQFPEYKLEFKQNQEGYEPYCVFYTNQKAFFGKLNVLYHSTILYETEYWTGDEMRRYLPKANVCHIYGLNKKDYWFYYYFLDSIEGKLLRLFTSEQLNYSSRGEQCIQFLVFFDSNEMGQFKKYLADNLEIIGKNDISEFQHQIDEDRKVGKRDFTAESIARIYLMYHKWKSFEN